MARLVFLTPGSGAFGFLEGERRRGWRSVDSIVGQVLIGGSTKVPPVEKLSTQSASGLGGVRRNRPVSRTLSRDFGPCLFSSDKAANGRGNGCPLWGRTVSGFIHEVGNESQGFVSEMRGSRLEVLWSGSRNVDGGLLNGSMGWKG